MYKMYGAKGCPACVNARAIFEANRLSFEFIDISSDPAGLMPKGFKTIPVIFDESGKLVGGYNDLLVHLSTK